LEQSVVLGQPAPALVLTGKDGKDVSLADYRNRRIVVLYFMNSLY